MALSGDLARSREPVAGPGSPVAHRRRLRLGAAASPLVAVALALSGPLPLAAAAQPGPTEEPAAATEPNPLSEAQQLYERGRAKFETADYRAAVDLWTEAYALVPDTSDGAQIRVLLIYNIATARERAFDVTQDPAELRQAKILLGNFEKSIATLYGEGEEADAERTRVQEKIAALDERLAEHERAQNPEPGPTPDPVETDPEPDIPEPDGSAKGLIIGGAVAAGLGVGGFALMGAGLSMGESANDISELADDDIAGRRDQFDRGRLGNRLALVGGIAGGLLLTTGAVLLAIGLKKRGASGSSSVAVRPSFGPNGGGLMLRGRF